VSSRKALGSMDGCRSPIKEGQQRGKGARIDVLQWVESHRIILDLRATRGFCQPVLCPEAPDTGPKMRWRLSPKEEERAGVEASSEFPAKGWTSNVDRNAPP
jgi:hypothetical protein